MNEIDPYTTLKVSEYTHMKEVILALRHKLQIVRELLEKSDIEGALVLLVQEKEG